MTIKKIQSAPIAPASKKKANSAKKILIQRTAIEDTELEELVVNGVAGVEVLARADKWDGQRLLATPIHKMAETGAIASSHWWLMVGPVVHQQP